MRPQRTTRHCLTCDTPFLPRRREIYCSRVCAYARGYTSFEEHFLSRLVKSDGCWTTTYKPHSSGYCCTTYRGKDVRLHNFAYELASGKPIPKGLFVMHICDNRACVRNDEPGIYDVGGVIIPRFGHLALGTAELNVKDMIIKGRHSSSYGDQHWTHRHPEWRARGENAVGVKLTELDVLAIRDIYMRGAPIREIARGFNLVPRTVRYIVTRATWTHI